MLSIKHLGPNADRYHSGLCREDYYLGGGEPPGLWWGKGASRLGMRGTIQAQQFSNLFAGMSPDGDQALVRNAGESKGPYPRKPGWDLVLSAPKSVSVIWSHAHELDRQRIQQSHLRAVQKALQYVEQNLAVVRRGAGGKSHEACGLVVGLFEHGTSRALDPQLHTHAVVLNLGVTKNGATGAIVSKVMYQHKMLVGAIYRAELARELLHLGYALRPVKTWFEVEGVPERVLRFFSKRRAQVEKELNDRGLETAAAAAAAALSTRPIKEVVPPRSELFQQWQQQSRELGFELRPNERRAAPTVHLPTHFESAIADLESRSPTFSELEVKTEMLIRGQCAGAKVAEILEATDVLLEESRSVLRLSDRDGQRRFTTPRTVELEQELFRMVKEVKDARRHHVHSVDVAEAINPLPILQRVAHDLGHHGQQILRAARGLDTTSLADTAAHLTLNEGQRSAVELLTSGSGQVQVLLGSAGTGKTRALSVCRELWESTDHAVIGVALSGKAALELEKKSGIASMTLAMFELRTRDTVLRRAGHSVRQVWRVARGKPTFKYKPLRLDSRTILVVDEAAMLGTSQLHTLVKMAIQSGAKLVLVGDDGQLKPIEAGRPLAELAKIAPSCVLSVPVRLKDLEDQRAAQQIREGEAGLALKNYKDRGRFFEAPSRDAAVERLVADWGRDCLKKPKGGVILCTTNDDADAINQKCQQARIAAGRLWSMAGVTVDGTRFLVGDRVLFTRPALKLGIVNGELGTITSIGTLGRTINVRLDDGRRLSVPARGPYPLGTDRYRHKEGPDAGRYALRLGYAMTTHRAQGSTFERAYVLLEGLMQDREMTYVQVTRAEKATFLYTDSGSAGYRNERLIAQMRRDPVDNLASTELSNEPKAARDPSFSR